MPPEPTESPKPTPPEPFPREPIHPDVLAWARQTTDREEFLAEVREVLAGKGRSFESLIAEVEAVVRQP